MSNVLALCNKITLLSCLLKVSRTKSPGEEINRQKTQEGDNPSRGGHHGQSCISAPISSCVKILNILARLHNQQESQIGCTSQGNLGPTPYLNWDRTSDLAAPSRNNDICHVSLHQRRGQRYENTFGRAFIGAQVLFPLFCITALKVSVLNVDSIEEDLGLVKRLHSNSTSVT